MESITVCKDCQDRQIGCHGICERYIRQRQKAEKEKELIRKNRKKEEQLRQRSIEGIKRMRRPKKRT